MEVIKDLGYHSEHNISPPSTGMITQNSSSNNEGNVPTSSTSKQDYPGQTCETSKKSSVPVQEGRMNNPTFVQFRRRQPVGRPIVGRPPIPPPIDPISETIAYTQLWYSWESLNSINSNIGHFDLIKEFDDLCNLYHSCEGEQNMNMSSYIKMVLDMKAKRSTEKFNNFSEAVSKLDREQAELVEFLRAHSIGVHPICNSAGMPAFKNSKQMPKYPSSAFSPSVVTMSERKFPATLNQSETKDQNARQCHVSSGKNEQSTTPFLCTFCRQNGETEEYYKSHNLKDAKGKIVCPTLRSFVCPYCKATGSNAHTASYCPSNADTVRTKHSPHKRFKDGYTRYSHGLKYTG